MVVVGRQQALQLLNPTGSWLWEALGEETFDLETASGRLAEAFELSDEVARRDVGAFLDEMVESGAFERVVG